MKKSCLKCKKKNNCPIEHGKTKNLFYNGTRRTATAEYCRHYTPIKS